MHVQPFQYLTNWILGSWQQECEKVKNFNANLIKDHAKKEKLYQAELREWENKVKTWEDEKKQFLENQAKHNGEVDALREAYENYD